MAEPTAQPGAPASPSGERRLPDGAPDWLPILALLPELTEASFAALCTVLDDPAPMPWREWKSWLVRAGVAQVAPDPGPAGLVVTAEWASYLDATLDELMDQPALRRRVTRLADPDHVDLMMKLVTWARRHERWDVMSEVWVQRALCSENFPTALQQAFTGLPAVARTGHPMLSWACAVAEADAAGPGGAAAAFLDRLVLDSATLHADWSLRQDTDAAVAAGIIRMFGERQLPPSRSPLEAAWRTKREIDAFIDERSRAGQGPGRLAQSFFQVMSARLALSRADLRGAVAEAHFGRILADDPPVSELAAAIESLAYNLAGEIRDAPLRDSRPLDSFRFGSLGQMAAIMTTLARGRRSLEMLDRAGVEASLAALTPDMTAIAGVSASVIGLRAMHAAVWGDPRLGLSEMMAALADQPMGAREQDEPLGSLMVGRARSILLCRIGAFEAAARCLDSVAEEYRSVPRARTLLWAGQLGRAVRAMELTLADPNLIHADRLQLLIIRGAATKLENSITPDIEGDTVSAFQAMVQARRYLPFAALPRPARDAILEICAQATEPDARGQFLELQERLTEVFGGDHAGGLIQLTDREAVLLPLLATSDSVPVIAKRLHLSVHTVRAQVATLREKFQASTRAELVRKAGDHGALK